jgi:allantoicase
MTDFTDLPDLACEAVGGAAILCNDEFFAQKENLLKADAAEWREHEYTDRGKWMDGWETRRFRPADGVAPGRDSEIHDWCVVRLGMPGKIRGVVVDTAFFRGNYPDTCAIWAATIDDPLDLRALDRAQWVNILPRSSLEGNSKNAFRVDCDQRFTHVRLDIYPDGGVARLRVHGEVVPRWETLLGRMIDLAALEHGAWVETCSDMFFGSRNNLIKPGPSLSMADGWETRRKRGPGHEWAIVRLAGPGTVERLEIDTSHFKGNAPALVSVEGKRPGEEGDWRVLLKTPVQPHTRHRFDDLRRVGDVTHLRVSVYPCGGIARLRAWGQLTQGPALPRLNVEQLLRCCGSKHWAELMEARQPFEDVGALMRAADRTWWSLGEADHLEAFGAHPRIGETGEKSASAWSQNEQAGAAGAQAAVLAELADKNREYEAKHGFIFIVCASGRSADAMLADLRARLANDRARELRTAAEEQAKITRLRLAKLLGELP